MERFIKLLAKVWIHFSEDEQKEISTILAGAKNSGEIQVYMDEYVKYK